MSVCVGGGCILSGPEYQTANTKCHGVECTLLLLSPIAVCLLPSGRSTLLPPLSGSRELSSTYVIAT